MEKKTKVFQAPADKLYMREENMDTVFDLIETQEQDETNSLSSEQWVQLQKLQERTQATRERLKKIEKYLNELGR